jgi:hypothetical protein
MKSYIPTPVAGRKFALYLIEEGAPNLFPAMAEDLRRQAAVADALAERLDYQESLRRPPCRQKALLSGLDCLEGQQDLFATDGPPDVVNGTSGRAPHR